MKSGRIQQLLAVAFLLSALGFFAWFNASKQRVLVVQSYDSSYPWTRDIDVALRRVLAANPHIAVRWHHMDTKRHPWQRFKENAGILARSTVDGWKPDILVAGDDDAQEYVATYYADDPHMQIVFLGINGQIEEYGYEGRRARITGILERKQFNGVRQLLLDHARLKGITRPLRLVHIGDDSASVKKDDEFLHAFSWAPIQLQESRLVSTFGDWQQAVKEAQKRADVILTTNYRKLTVSADDQTLVPPAKVVAWSEENSAVPLIGTNGFFVEDGGMLAIATSPYEQGEVAGQMTLDIIAKRKTPDRIPVAVTRQFIVSMRSGRIEARGFILPNVYESFARSTNNYFP